MALSMLITWASGAAILTNIIMDKFFSGTLYMTEISIGIAILLWLFGHMVFARLWAKKERVLDIAENIATDKIKSITKSKND